MIFSSYFLWLVLACLPFIHANVEKTIFSAPHATSISQDPPNQDTLNVIPISAPKWGYDAVRTYIQAAFPTDDLPYGLANWFLLTNLTPGQRYEVRICWLATQPTSFHIDTYTLDEVFSTPVLLTSLTEFADKRQFKIELDELEAIKHSPSAIASAAEDSILLLQVQAAADYFTLDKTMMEHVPPVLVDVILDPYLGNIFPTTLIPTAGYLVLVAVGAWFLSSFIWRFFQAYARLSVIKAKESTKVEKKTL